MNIKYLVRCVGLNGVTLFLLASPARADAHAVTISGNGWVALLIIIFFVAVIYFVIIGSMQAEERDGRLGRHGGGHEHGWFGMSGRDRGDDGSDSDSGN